MTCRRPTISVRAAVLQRLAEAASARNEEGSPDSLEFEAVSWEDLERTSLVEGLDAIVAIEKERVEAERRDAEMEVKRRENIRQGRIAAAQEWERSVFEKKRAEQLEIRLLQERLRVRQETTAEVERRAVEMTSHASAERALEVEIEKGRVIALSRKWKNTAWTLVAAAAVFALALGVSSDKMGDSANERAASLALETDLERRAAEIRVAELEAELERAETLRDEHRALVGEQLEDAQAHLAALEAETETANRRGQTDQPPRKMAEAPKVKKVEDGKSPATPGEGVTVATDIVPEAECNAYDPMCFEL